MQVTNRGRSLLDDWATAAPGTFAWALFLSAAPFDKDVATVDDLTPGSNEVTAVGYARADVDSPALVTDDATDQTQYSCTSPDFGSLTTGQVVGHLALIRVVTTDADSVPVAWHTYASPPDTADFDPFVTVFPADIIITSS
jgi:hypothetical protein